MVRRRAFTADDFVFWYEDIYLNEDLVPMPQASFAINGKQGRIEKVDDLTVSFVFEDPLPALPDDPRRHDLHGLRSHDQPRLPRRLLRAGSLPQAVPPQVHGAGRHRRDGAEGNVEDWIALFRQ